MTIPTIATLVELRDHLRLAQPTGSPAVGAEDADLQRKLDAATQLVCEYIADRNPADEDWIAEIESWGLGGSPAVVPPPVIVLAVLEQAAELYRFRGDDPGSIENAPNRERGYLSTAIENLLSRYRNRAFA